MAFVYATLVILAVGAHFAFLIYVASGGFLALALRRTIWLHAVAVAWGAAVVVGKLPCPLTWFESWARAQAGMGPLPDSGFIDHYVAGVVYPANATGVAQALAFSAVLVSWIAYAVTSSAARRRGSQAGAAQSVPHRGLFHR